MPRLILGIVGEKSSGKSIVFEYLKRKPGVRVARFSDVLNDVLRRLYLDEKNRLYQGRLAEALRTTFGVEVLARAVLTDTDKRKAAAVLDGVRKLGEYRWLRRQPRFKLLYVTAPARLRWQRAQARNQRRDDRVSFREFQAIERLPHEIEIPKIGKQADVRIDNIGTKHELLAKVEAALKKFGVRV